MHKFVEKIDEELKMLEKQVEKKDQMSAGDIELLNKLTKAKKNILESQMYEEYAEDGESYVGGSSYARGRNARRDSMGRYSRDDGMSYADEMDGRGRMSSRGGYSRERGYSRADGKDMMIEKLEDMAETADTKSREAIHRAIKQIENA